MFTLRFHHILLDMCNYLMMQSSIWQMVRTRSVEELAGDIPEGSTGRGRGQTPCGNAPPPLPPTPPVDIAQMLAMHNNLMNTQNELMRRMVENDERRGAGRPQHPRQQDMDSSYSDFLATHPPIFAEATDPLEADNWLRTTESKFGLLHCTEYQKTLEPGGLPTPPHYPPTIRFHGTSFAPPSVVITSRRVRSALS